MASQNLLGVLAIATAAYAAPANAAPENVSQDFANTNKATVIQVLEHQDASIQQVGLQQYCLILMEKIE